MFENKNLYALVVFEDEMPVEGSLVYSEDKAEILRTYDISRTAAKLAQHSNLEQDRPRYAKVFVNNYLDEAETDWSIRWGAQICMESRLWEEFGWHIIASEDDRDTVLDAENEPLTNDEMQVVTLLAHTLKGKVPFRQEMILASLKRIMAEENTENS